VRKREWRLRRSDRVRRGAGPAAESQDLMDTQLLDRFMELASSRPMSQEMIDRLSARLLQLVSVFHILRSGAANRESVP